MLEGKLMLETDFLKLAASTAKLLFILLCVFAPLTFFVNHHIKEVNSNLNFFKRISLTFSLNHESLFDQKLFIFTIQLSFTYFFIFGLMSWWGSSPDIGYEAFNNFMSRSKLPLGILSISAVLIVLIARAHGTEQTATQIKELFKKNNSDSYLNQKNDFLTYFKGSEIDINSYSYFFQSSIEKGSCQADRNKILEAKHAIEFSLRAISIIEDAFHSKDENYDLNDIYFIAMHALIKLNRTFNIHTYRKSLKHSNNRYYCVDNTKTFIPQIPLKSVVLSLIELIEAYNKICDYCQSNERFDEDNVYLKHAINLVSEGNSSLIIKMNLEIRKKNGIKNMPPSLKPIKEHCLDNFKL